MNKRTIYQAFCIAVVMALIMVQLGMAGEGTPPVPANTPINRLERGMTSWDGENVINQSSQLSPQASSPVVTNFSYGWSKIVFETIRDSNWEIFLMDGSDGSQVRLTWDPADDINPRLNQFCTRIVFASKRTGNYDIFAMNLDGSGLVQLTNNSKDDVNPYWSPDGTKIVFQSYRDGQSEIYLMNSDGSAQNRLTRDKNYDGEPVWSPDGGKIAFVSNSIGGYRIWLMDTSGGGLVALSNQPYSEDPVFSPDGSQIAFDSDGNNDGWMELWLMNADGSNRRQVYKPMDWQTDAWAHSWSPDGRYLAFTRISWIYYNRKWYWTAAYLDAWDGLNPMNTERLSTNGVDMNPDWQTLERGIPASSIDPLPGQSPWQFTVSWSGQDSGPSAIMNFDVQVKDGATGAWTDWQMGTTNTSAIFTNGVGGHTYYFRCRSMDNARNQEPWPDDYDAQTTVEKMAPQTQVNPLPQYIQGGHIDVSWAGMDPGASGILNYDVQYKDLPSDWVDWIAASESTGAGFDGQTGHTYCFRSRATDRAQNVESWPSGDGDICTSLYAWSISGAIRDNREVPVIGADIPLNPPAFATQLSDESGNYMVYAGVDAPTYTVSWAKTGYTSLPGTIVAGGGQNAQRDAILAPADNIVKDWGFEQGAIGSDGWIPGGDLPALVTAQPLHTGNYAASLNRPRPLFVPFTNLTNQTSDQYPQIEADPSGAVHVVWVVDWNLIRYARRDSSGTWSAPQDISMGVPQSGDPQMTIDSTGKINVLWKSGGESELYYAWRYTDADRTWSKPYHLGTGQDPYMTVAADGTLHVAWVKIVNGGECNIVYARRASNGTWDTPLDIFDQSGCAASPRLAIDGNGTVHLAWLHNAQFDYANHVTVRYAWRDGAGVWSTPQVLTDNQPLISGLRMVAEGDGIVHVVWNFSRTFYHRRASDGSWSTPQDIGPDCENLQIALDQNGSLHVACNTDYIIYNKRDPDGNWSEFHEIPGSFGGARSLQMLVEGDGTVHLVFSGEYFVNYVQGGRDGTWSSLQGGGLGYYPRIAIDAHRTVHLVTDCLKLLYTHSIKAVHNSKSTLSQTMTIPARMQAPTLSFQYQLTDAFVDGGAWFGVQASQGVTSTTLFSTTTSTDGWKHVWLDMSPWAGQTITLTLGLYEIDGPPIARAALDEVSLGSAYPDVWVKMAGSSFTTPDKPVTYQISYGNRGAVPAMGVILTDTLPAGLTFESASLQPTTTAPLTWDLGNLPAGSGPFTITLTATVSSSAVLCTLFTNTAQIGGLINELQVLNNIAQLDTWIGYRIVLPLEIKE